MKNPLLDWVLPSLTAVFAATLLWGWNRIEPPLEISPRVAGLDRLPESLSPDELADVELARAGQPIAGTGKASPISGAWPGFRGPELDGINHEQVALANQWPESGPTELWRIELCEGYASPAIDRGRAYVLDYDEFLQHDVLRCLSFDDGSEIWRNSYPVAVTRNHGITRTMPVIKDDCVITMGPRCHVACWNATTGENRWLIDLTREFHATVPRWYAGQCPLIDNNRLILATGGDALLVAIEYQTGKVIWRSENPRSWEMAHGSVTPITMGDQTTYVYCGSGGIAGIDGETGKLLWDNTDWPVQFAHAPSPVSLGNGRFLVSSGYGNQTGAMILQIESTGDAVRIEQRLSPKQFNSEQQTPIVFGDYLFGVRKRGGGVLVCMDLEGNESWNSHRDRFGHGPYLIADNKIFVLSDGGELTMARADATSYQVLAKHQVFTDGHDAWGPLTMVQGRMILRDSTRMACLDLRPPNARDSISTGDQP